MGALVFVLGRLTCEPAPGGLATCRAQEIRWLGRVAADPVAIPGVRAISARSPSGGMLVLVGLLEVF